MSTKEPNGLPSSHSSGRLLNVAKMSESTPSGLWGKVNVATHRPVFACQSTSAVYPSFADNVIRCHSAKSLPDSLPEQRASLALFELPL